jgi:uncharacterized protein Veg
MNGKFMRQKLTPYLGKQVEIHYNLGRNKSEKYSGKIIQLFPNIFIFEEDNGSKKCFSYSDILTKTVKLNFPTSNLE